MSYFTGKIIGGKPEDVTLRSTVSGTSGAISVRLWRNKANDDYYQVTLHPISDPSKKVVILSMGKLDADDTGQANVYSLMRNINAIVAQAESLRH